MENVKSAAKEGVNDLLEKPANNPKENENEALKINDIPQGSASAREGEPDTPNLAEDYVSGLLAGLGLGQ